MDKEETIEQVEINLCEYLDTEVYLPVKKELEGIGRTYSLGFRKENFKGFIHEELKKIEQGLIQKKEVFGLIEKTQKKIRDYLKKMFTEDLNSNEKADVENSIHYEFQELKKKFASDGLGEDHGK